MNNNLRKLSNLNGVTGDETLVKEYIIGEITPFVDSLETTIFGDIIAFKKGRKSIDKKIMLSAHMDEVGFILTYIDDNGLVKFSPVGGIDPEVVTGKILSIGKNNIPAVVCQKPIHLLSSSEKEKKMTLDDMYLDLGVTSREEAEKLVELGDTIAFSSNFEVFGDDFLIGKALDDRGGCAILMDIIKRDLENDLYFVFNTGEEAGGQFGSKVVTHILKPDIAIVVEFTTSGDNAGFTGGDKVSTLGKGPVISYMDRGTIYHKGLYKKAIEIANEKGIQWQTKTGIFGGNDSATIHKSGSGVKTISVSVPCRNLHSANNVAKISDIKESRELVMELANGLADFD